MKPLPLMTDSEGFYGVEREQRAISTSSAADCHTMGSPHVSYFSSESAFVRTGISTSEEIDARFDVRSRLD